MSGNKNYASSVQEKLNRMLQGTGRSSNVNPLLYSPKARSMEEIQKNPEYIRVLPYLDFPDPFLELKMHYNIGTSILCPKKTPYCDRDECPICDFMESIMKKDFKTAIKRIAEDRVHIPIVIRGQEFNKDGTPNIKFWSLPSKYTPGYTRELPLSMIMMNAVNDADIGQFWDVDNGIDIKVVKLEAAKDEYSKITIEFSRRTSPLMLDKAQRDLLVSSVPKWEDAVEVPTTEKLEQALAKWVESLQKEQEKTGTSSNPSQSADNIIDEHFDNETEEDDLSSLEDRLNNVLGKK